eukprot:gene12953-biopygen5719
MILSDLGPGFVVVDPDNNTELAILPSARRQAAAEGYAPFVYENGTRRKSGAAPHAPRQFKSRLSLLPGGDVRITVGMRNGLGSPAAPRSGFTAPSL